MINTTPQETELSFEDALQQVRELVSELENDDLTLEESMASYQKGTKLIDLCREIIAKAELRVTELAREHED